MRSNPNARWFTALSSCLLIAMTSFSAASSWGQSDAGPDTAKQTDKGATAVKPEQAEPNLIEKVAPVYPPLAKQVRIQGKVKLQVVISKTGRVDSVNVMSGHPLLAGGAPLVPETPLGGPSFRAFLRKGGAGFREPLILGGNGNMTNDGTDRLKEKTIWGGALLAFGSSRVRVFSWVFVSS
jgi:hypothetical protein